MIEDDYEEVVPSMAEIEEMIIDFFGSHTLNQNERIGTSRQGPEEEREGGGEGEQENERINDPIILRRDDVQFGKGAAISEYPGNKRMRHIIDSRLREYWSIPKNAKKQKSEYADQVIQEIMAGGRTRFLTRGANEFGPLKEVSKEEIHNKIIKLFGDRKKKLKLSHQPPDNHPNSFGLPRPKPPPPSSGTTAAHNMYGNPKPVNGSASYEGSAPTGLAASVVPTTATSSAAVPTPAPVTSSTAKVPVPNPAPVSTQSFARQTPAPPQQPQPPTTRPKAFEWQYLDDKGWRTYPSGDDQVMIEENHRMYRNHLKGAMGGDPHSKFIIRAGRRVYEINFEKMTQKRINHKNRRERPIQRIVHVDNIQNQNDDRQEDYDNNNVNTMSTRQRQNQSSVNYSSTTQSTEATTDGTGMNGSGDNGNVIADVENQQQEQQQGQRRRRRKEQSKTSYASDKHHSTTVESIKETINHIRGQVADIRHCVLTLFICVLAVIVFLFLLSLFVRRN